MNNFSRSKYEATVSKQYILKSVYVHVHLANTASAYYMYMYMYMYSYCRLLH